MPQPERKSRPEAALLGGICRNHASAQRSSGHEAGLSGDLRRFAHLRFAGEPRLHSRRPPLGVDARLILPSEVALRIPVHLFDRLMSGDAHYLVNRAAALDQTANAELSKTVKRVAFDASLGQPFANLV